MNSVNVVNVGERMGSATFITYPDETKRLVNVVNVVGKYFGSRAHCMPKGTNQLPWLEHGTVSGLNAEC